MAAIESEHSAKAAARDASAAAMAAQALREEMAQMRKEQHASHEQIAILRAELASVRAEGGGGGGVLSSVSGVLKPSPADLRRAFDAIDLDKSGTIGKRELYVALRAIGNAIQVFFKDGTSTENIVVDYPVGHRRRRSEGIPLLKEKFERYLRGSAVGENADRVLEICGDQATFESTSVAEMASLLQADA